jgi:thiol-disulfide isomerase/thioredoxin
MYLKKTIACLILISSSLLVMAQNDPSANTLNAIKNLPDFRIAVAPDSTIFTASQLNKNKPFVLIMFNPDCDHCQRETKELLAYKEELKGLQIVMASPTPFRQVKEFYEEYTIASMPGIKMGHDENLALVLKYQVRTYPSIFVYDAKGKLAKAFIGNASVPAILDAVK